MKIWDTNSADSERATIISGGQIGADIAGLRAAHACGLRTAGWMPKGYRTLLGPLPAEEVELYNLDETEERNYLVRTEKNVQAADGTIRFAYDFDSAGEKATLRFIKKHGRPYFDISLLPGVNQPWVVLAPEFYRWQVCRWIEENEIEILNVAGNGNQEIESCVERFLVGVFQQLAQREGR